MAEQERKVRSVSIAERRQLARRVREHLSIYQDALSGDLRDPDRAWVSVHRAQQCLAALAALEGRWREIAGLEVPQ